MAKKKIKIELTEEEDAQMYSEKTLGRNKTIQKKSKGNILCIKGC